MSKRNIVAVVGRPNVGKSTLFNALAGSRIAIVQDTPGVTRDRIYQDVEWLNHSFTLIDTGGIEPDSKDIILAQMRDQAQIAIDTADVIIFMVDVKQGLTDSDSKVADMLRKSGKPIVLCVNKVDNYNRDSMDVYEFYNLGIGEPFPISAVNKQGIGDLLEEVVSHFSKSSTDEEEDDSVKIAIIGKPNVGKSSIINLLDKELSKKDYGLIRVNLWDPDGKNNGLRRVIEAFKGNSEFGYIELQNIWRSKLAQLAELL